MKTMYQFDYSIINFFEKYFPHSHSFYKIIFFIADDNLLKGGVIASIIWYLWFKNKKTFPAKNINIVATIIASFTTIFVSRSITMMVPFRARPILDSSFSYFAFETDKNSIDQMSSFPSDHAALFVALATGIFFISKRTGIFALLYTALFILFPRIYLGYHYPSDIITGGLIGAVISIIFNKSSFILGLISRFIMPFEEKYPQWCYPIFFFITFQIVVLFSDLRMVASFISHHNHA